MFSNIWAIFSYVGRGIQEGYSRNVDDCPDKYGGFISNLRCLVHCEKFGKDSSTEV